MQKSGIPKLESVWFRWKNIFLSTMQIMYKSKEHLESLLAFVDETQMESITWLALIGMKYDISVNI